MHTRTTAHTILDFAQRPNLKPQIEGLMERVWPRFITHGHSPNEPKPDWESLFTLFPEYQFIVLDEGGEVLASGHSVPFVWSGQVEGLPAGWDGVMVQAVQDHQAGRRPTAISAVGIAVSAERRTKGLASQLINAMRDLARRKGLQAMVAPVRPNWKERYPLTSMERYVQWQRDDGLPLDPWIRTHWRLGARPLAVAQSSMTLVGSVAEWEQWTGMSFPDSGRYVVPGALVPISIDRQRDQGCYEEPNLWMRHLV